MLINHAFFSQHWQRKPLLLRQAVRLPENSPDKKLLFSLAGDENIETRLVLEHGERPWEVHYGPFSSTELDQLPGSRWTILFQDMDKHLQEVAELLAQFEGMPRWRIDDIMISYATDQGGVGPHSDAYDVFLMQGVCHNPTGADMSPEQFEALLDRHFNFERLYQTLGLGS